MNIELDDHEYNLLLDMLFIANWTINAQHVEIPPEFEPYNMIEQKVLSLGQSKNLEGKFQYDSEAKKYLPVLDYETDLHKKFIDPYEIDTFWDTLIGLLAERDLIREIGIEAYNTMDRNELTEKIFEIEDKYRLEFSKNNLDNAHVHFES
jgi:hypothetical protein